MTEFYTFAGEHPWLTFFLACIGASVVIAPFRFLWSAWNRYLRSKNIAARGWPPAHLDADGDWQPVEDPE